jgi:RNA polymerase sigma-70 factor (ECF subfamily)
MSREDDDVVVRARAGDEDAWRELYVRHGRRLVAWLGATTHGDAAVSADDIAAEAWTVAATKIGEFRGSVEEFGGWLIAIARNITANTRRRAQRRQTYATDDLEAQWERHVPPPDAGVVGADQTRWLLGQLSPREAEVIACIDVVGLDVASTALALDMSPTAVRVARFRGLGRLRKILGGSVQD